ncbi:MAG TPA: membrane protein insertase YidC [Caulobacteraceae bacterium]|nr:membrane protein insertase YidC [Caulobacteraceae bacterium]
MSEDNRNWILFTIVAAILFLAYQQFVIGPAEKQAQKSRAAAAAQASSPTAAPAPLAPRLTRAQALALSPRIPIDTPALTGSLSLRGARIDDLFLKDYHVEVSQSSPLVELLRPEGMADAYFAQSGWAGANLQGLPDAATLWTLTSGSTLSPGHPLTLTYAAPSGLIFTRTIAVDDHYMFTITDQVANRSAAAVSIAPYVSVQRQGLPVDRQRSRIVHEGAIGILGLGSADLRQASYASWKKKGEEDWQSTGGWLGITDKYWMTAFIPAQNQRIDAKIRVTPDPATGIDIYEATYSQQPLQLGPGASATVQTRLFAGAKTVPVLSQYQSGLGIPRFDDAVDWGLFWVLTKPIFWLLEQFHRAVGNFGVAILMLTVVVRLITFPLANKGFEMGVKMKKLQPQLQELQKKFKSDPQAQQREMMALYQREKVNPVTGCFPILLQIPIFYALTKLFTVTIEMRHAPFFGWIHDLSARDPTTFLNLFGLIPWDPATTPLLGPTLGGALHIGAWPLLYGGAMWLSQSMTPQTGIDPTQQLIFKLMPFFFTFILAQYSVGLLIYWTWSSLISIAQQYVLMRRFKVANPIDDFLARFAAKPEPT